MNCYECAIRGETVAAVAICPHCGAGVCLEHLQEEQTYEVGGTHYACPHNLAARRTSRGMAAGISRSNGSEAVAATR